MKKIAKTTLLFIFLASVCGYAEYTFDNEPDIKEKENKRDMEREEARKALERMRFGVRFGVAVGENPFGSDLGGELEAKALEMGIMLNIPLSRLKDGNLLIATELNYGRRDGFSSEEIYDNILGFSRYKEHDYEESFLDIPLTLQYVSFFFPVSNINAHLLPSPKRHFLMHLKTMVEAGAFLHIPLGTKIGDAYEGDWEDYGDRNFFDPGIVVGGAFQLESITLGVRISASYTDMGSSALLLMFKGYLGYLF